MRQWLGENHKFRSTPRLRHLERKKMSRSRCPLWRLARPLLDVLFSNKHMFNQDPRISDDALLEKIEGHFRCGEAAACQRISTLWRSQFYFWSLFGQCGCNVVWHFRAHFWERSGMNPSCRIIPKDPRPRSFTLKLDHHPKGCCST